MDIPNLPPNVRWCCTKLEFRVTEEENTVQGPTGPAIATRQRCVVCNNNHYILNVPPIPFGINGKEMG